MCFIHIRVSNYRAELSRYSRQLVHQIDVEILLLNIFRILILYFYNPRSLIMQQVLLHEC